MNFLDVLRSGDKIDIHVTKREAALMQGNVMAKKYKSSVYDVISNEEVQVAMPMEGNKIVLFETGVRISLIFYTKRGLYSGEGLVTKRFKEDNHYVMTVSAMAPLKKFQRREFFRINKVIDLKYCCISEDVAALPTTEELFMTTQNPENHYETLQGKILDISGGGIRFSSEEAMEKDSYILSVFQLTNSLLDKTFYLVAQIIESVPTSGSKEKRYINRAKFMLKNLKDREAIVRYIFEEERQMRKKEIG